jgi:thioesterase III
MNTVMEKRIWNYQTDSFRVVHHARYLEIMEEARWAYCHENNLIEPFHQEGMSHVIVNINIDYFHSASFNDVIIVDTALYKVTEKSIIFRQTIRKDDRTIVRAGLTNVYLNRKGEVLPVHQMAFFWDDLRIMIAKGNHD